MPLNDTTAVARVLNTEASRLELLGRDIYAQLLQIADWMPRFRAAKSLRAVCREAAGVIDGVTESSLYRRVRDFLRTGNWESLIDRRDVPALWESADVVGLPAAFREFYRGLLEKHSRVASSAHAELVQIWRTRTDASGKHYEKIDGYEQWPAEVNPFTGLPRGWSYRNLKTAVDHDPYDKAAARQGLFAASMYRPPVLTTRVGLKLGERVEFDDHEFDCVTHFPGQPRAMRPFCFGGVEGLSGFTDLMIRPVFWDTENEVKKKYSEFQFRCFVIHWLTVHGYRADAAGTTFFTERGTAVIREAFARALHHATGGSVKVCAGAMFSESAHAGQFAPRGKGNFRHKPAVEGFWRDLENLLDRLPGQTGSNARLNGPAELHGRMQYLERVLKAVAKLEPERAASAILPVLTFRRFAAIAHETLREHLDDTKHDLEGWDKLNFEKLIWRADATALQWHDEEQFALLPPVEQMLLRPRLADPAQQLTMSRRLSRREVWQQGAAQLARVSPRQYHRLFPEEDGFEVTVGKDRLIRFTDRERFGPEEFCFLARDKRKGDYLPGEKFTAFFNPLNPVVLQLCQADGSHEALLEAWEAPARNDVEAIKRMAGKQAAWEAPRKHALGARHHDEAESRAHMIEHNRALVAGQAGANPITSVPVSTPEQTSLTARLAAITRSQQQEAGQ